MANSMILRTTLLACIILGVLFAIIATAGKEWVVYDNGDGYKITSGLWESCSKSVGHAVCFKISISLEDLTAAQFIATRAFMIISILLYNMAFILLALVQFAKKEQYQKIVAAMLWGTMSCGIVAMSCYSSLTIPITVGSFGWTYGLGWASVCVALVGSIISTISLCTSSTNSA